MKRFLFIPTIFASLATMSPAFAGELGVTNSYGSSFRYGTGVTHIDWTTNSQTTEQSGYGAIKVERSRFNGETTFNPNNGFGNGNQTPPGNSGGNNNAENGNGGNGGVSQPQVPFSDSAFSASLGFGTRNYNETTNVTGNTVENFTFGSNNFTHSVGVFSR